ncbi:hypothetical protein KWV16_07450 [Clostridioides difficile]|nr:hypothetical protein [Clostridioides difficile]
MKIGLLSVGFPNFRYDYGQIYLDSTLNKFMSLEHEIITTKKILIYESEIFEEINRLSKENIDLLILQCGTYSYGSAMMKVLEKLREIPLLLWGFTEPRIEGFNGLPLNSLCALNMYGSFLEKVGKKYSYVYGKVDDETVYEKVHRTIKAISIKKKLSKSKFCIIGGRVPGFYLSNVDEVRFRCEIGPEIVYYSIAEMLRDMDRVSNDEIDEEVLKMKSEVNSITATDEMLRISARMYITIKKFKELNNIDGFTIKCWPELQEIKNMSACGVISRLNNDGIMASCEGDVTGLVTQYIQYLITNKPCFFADLVNLNDNNTLKTWHCGPAPVCLARDFSSTKYTEHPTMRGVGFSVEFYMKLSRVNMLKVKESNKEYKMFIALGESVKEDRQLLANQADIKFDSDSYKVLDTIMEHGIEHHYAIVFEDIKEDLIEVCKWMNIKPIVI